MQLTGQRKWGEGSIGGWGYSRNNTPVLPKYEKYCIMTIHNHEYSWVVEIRNTSEVGLRVGLVYSGPVGLVQPRGVL